MHHHLARLHNSDPVPPNAIQISVWRDGSPLYCVEYLYGFGGFYIGYYIPTMEKVYIMAGRVLSSTHVKILVLNWSIYIECSVIDDDFYSDEKWASVS